MSVRVLTYDDVVRLLPMDECIDLMHDTLARLARGEGYQPLRSIAFPPDSGGGIGLMPAWRGGERPTYGLKAINVVPDNPRVRGLDTHQGAVLISDGESGALEAVVNAAAITEIRTAAVSGAATRALARDDARVLGVLGAGAQARGHLRAMAAARPFEHARIWGRDPEQARRLADDVELPFPLEVVAHVEEAVRGSDVVVTATAAETPIVQRPWFADGTHINAVGSSIPRTRELDGATVAASTLFVDRRESAENEAGDFLLAVKEGTVSPDHITAELGEVFAGMHPGRTSRDEITLFKSLGIAMEDLAAGEYVLRKAQEQGVGSEVPF
ncbi:MAG TPA: ornithine cyclodeaminase family protein [Gaiellaceae bacterium]|nr:ornithine cyclodeaminase family protein [Gaiellaceae bacterium]